MLFLCFAATTTRSTHHHNEGQTVAIVSGTTGAIVGALIILVVVVSCQRRLHYHHMRRRRLRHRQDQDAFTAFITYHRDVRLMLPSYDEAMTQEDQGQPPSFEEALGHCEELTLPTGDVRTDDSPPSLSTVSPNPPVSENSVTRNSRGNGSDTAPLLHDQSPDSAASENSRFLRSLRALFGGRGFRPDAIYCRFVPEERSDEQSSRMEESGSSRNDSADSDLTEVLTRAGLC